MDGRRGNSVLKIEFFHVFKWFPDDLAHKGTKWLKVPKYKNFVHSTMYITIIVGGKLLVKSHGTDF